MVKNMPANAGDTGDMGSIPGLGRSPEGGLDSKESACNAGYLGSIPGLGRFPGEGNGNPLQYSCLENSMDRGAWRPTVHGVTKSWTQLSTVPTVLIHLKDPFQCQSNIYHNSMWNN